MDAATVSLLDLFQQVIQFRYGSFSFIHKQSVCGHPSGWSRRLEKEEDG